MKISFFIVIPKHTRLDKPPSGLTNIPALLELKKFRTLVKEDK